MFNAFAITVLAMVGLAVSVSTGDAISFGLPLSIAFASAKQTPSLDLTGAMLSIEIAPLTLITGARDALGLALYSKSVTVQEAFDASMVITNGTIMPFAIQDAAKR